MVVSFIRLSVSLSVSQSVCLSVCHAPCSVSRFLQFCAIVHFVADTIFYYPSAVSAPNAPQVAGLSHSHADDVDATVSCSGSIIILKQYY